MKRVSTVAAQQSRKIAEQKLTIGLDLGDRWSWYCVLDKAPAGDSRTETQHDGEGDARSIRRHAALSDRAGNGDAFAVGEPGAE